MEIAEAIKMVREYLEKNGADEETMKAMDCIRNGMTEILYRLMRMREVLKGIVKSGDV